MSTSTATAVPSRTSSLWGGAVLFGAGVVVLFAPTLLAMQQVWELDPNYSHGYLVLPIALLFAYFALADAGKPVQGEVLLGSLYIGCGILVHPVATLYSQFLVEFVALALVLRGIAVLLGGRSWANYFTFSILFLVFMFPLPRLWVEFISLWLQDLVSSISAAVLDLFFVCYKKGTSLHIAGIRDPLVVAEECSGLRQLFAFLALGAMAGQLARRPMGFRVVLMIAALPIAVLANLLRVLLMAFGARYFGTEWMRGWLHHAPMLFSLPVGIILFYLLDRGLARLWFGRRAGKEAA